MAVTVLNYKTFLNWKWGYRDNKFGDDGEWSLGDAVYRRLMEKEQIMLDAIDNHILEAMPTSDEDLDKIFDRLFWKENCDGQI